LRKGTERHLPSADREVGRVREDFELVEAGLADALKETRQISSDLRLPELEGLALPEVVEKAKLDYERKTGSTVGMAQASVPASVSLSLKIVVYRVLQEALNNSLRHAGAQEQRISVAHSDGWLTLEVSDGGPGFDVATVEGSRDDRAPLGLRGMRERVEMLGGTLLVDSSAAGGTTVRAKLPLEGEMR
jgi:signal transduction histidine kinase